MAPSAAIPIPTVQQNDQYINSSVESTEDEIFTPIDSLSTSVSSASINDGYIEDLELELDSKAWTNERPIKVSWATELNEEETTDVLTDEATAIRFGHGKEAWLYHPQSGVFDLTRQSATKLHVPSHSDNMTGVLLDPARTMLVVVDMQNFFISPRCYSHVAGLAAVDPTLAVMKKCRSLGIRVSFLNWVIDEKDMIEMPPAVQRGWSVDRLRSHGVGWNVNLGSELPGDQGRCLWKGSWNAELYPPVKDAALPEDPVFLKNRPSGMWSSDCDMARYMKGNNVKTVLFAGVNTDQCVLGTLTDCYSKSYDCIMISDCVGTATTGLMAQELVEYNVERNYGFVVDSGCIERARMVRR